MTRRMLVGALVLGAATAGCGGPSTGDRVDAYVKAANTVQASAAPAFAEAERGYARFQRHRVGDSRDVRRLRAAEGAIRRTESQLARIPAPPPARPLRAALLHVYRLDAGLAHETVLLAQYAPARRLALKPLARANDVLVPALTRAKQPPAQAAALAAYRRRVDRALSALRRIKPPPVAASIHRGQIARLAATRRLAGALRAAVLARDPRRTARLVVAFRQVNVRGGEHALQTRDLEAYAARRRAIGAAVAQVKRVQARLEPAS